MFNPLLLIDFYKATHKEQYPEGLTKMVSYYTPRISRLDDTDQIGFFGLQAFIKEYLIEGFNEAFFNRDEEEVVAEYERVLTATLGAGTFHSDKIRNLHRLGYLPLRIAAVAEGTSTAVGVPQIEITNTHPDFVWLVNTIETLMSCSMWHTQVAMEVGRRYRKITNYWCEKTCDESINPARMIGDFSMRGQHSVESATKASAAWLLSNWNTATVPAIMYLEKYYNCDCTKEPVGYGAVSTEHSVMCSSFAVDGDEVTQIKRLLTEVYPNVSFSMVSDSYDYWNLVDNLLPQCKKEIMNHNGCLLIRGDSGNPVKVVTETVFHLWEQFGGTINSKGYKVLDSHVKAIYGDSITPDKAEAAYRILEENGFAASNIVLGAGSLSMMALVGDNGDGTLNFFEPGKYGPYTRDTFGIAVKATYAEDKDGNPIFIYKQPKALAWKKSQKGCCVVYNNGNKYFDGVSYKEAKQYEANELIPVFHDGKMIKEYTLAEVRKNMWGE